MTTKLASEDMVPLPSDTGSLGNRINWATRKQHSRINALINLKMVFALRNARTYRKGIQAFYHVFNTFEQCWDEEKAKDTPMAAILREVWQPAMARTVPLERDLMFYYGDRSKFESPVLPAQVDFVAHIRKRVADKPHLLLAYGHVMYLALFAGGRILRSKLAMSAGLFPHVEGMTAEEVMLQGTNLFRFEVDDEEALRLSFKKTFELQTRNALSEQQKREIIEESLEIFRRNTEMVSEIERVWRARLVASTTYVVLYRLSIAALVGLVVYAALHGRHLMWSADADQADQA
ncbi:uncharacterized protein V1510DRAFT_412013 [Dipodascopsis tothii]|uniref:uncharacterized protein n=1 Tax=Dipodascopsis tothii TaxID=44089 RepID=UPI0034CDDAA0